MIIPVFNGKTDFTSPAERRRRSFLYRLAAFMLMACLFCGVFAQTAEASVTGGTADLPKDSRTTMYVSSALTGRHGLCVLLENVDGLGNKQYGMIDTGNAGSAATRSFLRKHGVKSLEFLILTHMHKDHFGNAAWIIKNYPVKKLYVKQFDATWSNGVQSAYENILRAALLSPYTKQIYGVSYALSINKIASPLASSSFVSFLKAHQKDRGRFKGLFKSSNTSLTLGQTVLKLYNWEIWAENGVNTWVPGKNNRCKAGTYSTENSDNNFSMGVLVSRGKHKIWIGGDMTNLRLQNMKYASYKGDEERLASKIGKVDAAVLNHHGRGGSNVASFLKRLSPTYVIYTSTKADIMSGSTPVALSTYNYIRNSLHVPASRILWANNRERSPLVDPTITLYMANRATVSKNKTEQSPVEKALIATLLPGETCSSYDLTGDGKKDIVSITGSRVGGTCGGLSISINNKVVWSTKTSFTDKKPVRLLRMPGRQPYILISILDPVGSTTGNNVLSLCKYGKKSGTGSTYGLVTVYNYLSQMPVNQYKYRGLSSVSCSADKITVTTEGSDTLNSSAYVTFVLKSENNSLKAASTVFPYAAGSKTGRTITLSKSVNLYSSLNAGQKSSDLAKGTKITLTGVAKNKGGVTRYRIIDSNKKVWWINAPASNKVMSKDIPNETPALDFRTRKQK